MLYQDITLLDQTINLAKLIARQLTPGDVVTMKGELGAGKTFISKHIIETLTHSEQIVTSPTFQLLQIYKAGSYDVYHFDLYRLKRLEEIYELGIDEAFNGNNISIIEWPEIAVNLLPKNRIEMEIIVENDKRKCIVSDYTGKLKL